MPILSKKFLNTISSVTNNQFFKTGGIYTISTIVEKAIPFLLIPILTRYLTTEDYGIVSMFSVLVGLTLPFLGYNGHSAILRSYFKDDVDIPSYIGNALFILICSSIAISAVFIFFSDLISHYSKFPQNWLPSVILVSFFQFCNNIILVIWQAKKEAMRYGFFKILLTSINMGVAIILIVGLGFGWEGRVIGKMVALISFGIIALAILSKENLIKFQFMVKYIKHILSYGLPLIPHVLSGFMITMIDRVFITNMVSISETGIYTVGYQVGMIVGVVSLSINKAWTPWLYENLNEGSESAKKRIVKLTYIIFAAIIGLSLVLSILAPWFMQYLVGKNFYDATIYITWIAFGYTFNGMYFMVAGYIFYEEKTYLLSWMTFIAAGLNIILNYLFILNYGAVGAAYATGLTYFFHFLLTWYLASKIYQMPWFSFK